MSIFPPSIVVEKMDMVKGRGQDHRGVEAKAGDEPAFAMTSSPWRRGIHTTRNVLVEVFQTISNCTRPYSNEGDFRGRIPAIPFKECFAHAKIFGGLASCE